MGEAWLVVTDSQDVGALSRLLPDAPVTAMVIGDRALAESAAVAGVAVVHWIEPDEGVPAEAYAGAAAASILASSPRLVAATALGPASRAVLGAVAAGCGATLLSGVTAVRDAGDRVEVTGGAAGGDVVATYAVPWPLCALVVPSDDVPAPDPSVRVAPLAATDSPVRVTARRVSQPSGLADAARVVGVGRGLRSKADLDLVRGLADRLGAELACSMPLADDLGWLPRDRFLGRSGQQISPRLYLAVGLSGAPQHLQGVRGAKVIVGINSDPGAGIFRASDYGIVGDLYEIVPALTEALARG